MASVVSQFETETLPWLPIILSFVQFILLGLLTIYTFRNGSRQKVRERQAAWYHKVVVDPLIPRIEESFCSITPLLHEAAKIAERDRTNGLKSLSSDLKQPISKFKAALFTLASDLSLRLSVFSQKLERDVAAEVDHTEEEVTAWFDGFLNSEPHDQRLSLDNIIRERHTKLLTALMSFEFDSWGWPH